jgi:hypothetical protein
MRYFPTKKALQLGITQVVQMAFCVHKMNEFMNEYEFSSVEDAWKFWLELEPMYIDLNFNYGYSISTVKVAEIDDYGFGEYRCRATLNKII